MLKRVRTLAGDYCGQLTRKNKIYLLLNSNKSGSCGNMCGEYFYCDYYKHSINCNKEYYRWLRSYKFLFTSITHAHQLYCLMLNLVPSLVIITALNCLSSFILGNQSTTTSTPSFTTPVTSSKFTNLFLLAYDLCSTCCLSPYRATVASRLCCPATFLPFKEACIPLSA